MRVALGAAVVALIGLALYAFLEPPEEPRTPVEPEQPEPAREPAPPLRETLEQRVAAWTKRGAAAVPELVALLRSGDDEPAGGTWELADGRLVSFPTKRAAWITALAAIDDPAATAALRAVLATTTSTGETFLVARALAARGAEGWGPGALNRVDGDAAPAEAHLERQIIAVVARADPGTMARRIEDTAPRGKRGRNPALARGLSHLPWDAARDVGTRLLEDAAVVPKARRRYAEALLDRPEPDAADLVRASLARTPLDEKQRERVVRAAVESSAYDADVRVYDRARGTGAEAQAARARVVARVAAARRLIEALGGDAGALDRHLARVGAK